MLFGATTQSTSQSKKGKLVFYFCLVNHLCQRRIASSWHSFIQLNEFHFPSTVMSDEEEELLSIDNVKPNKRRKVIVNEFIDDEAQLSGDDEVSDDELEGSDDDGVDEELVDKEAPELDSDQEEEVRGLYHKQLETEDRRAVLLLQEHLEDNDLTGQRRRRKFRWQTKELMDNSLRRHYEPDDDDSQEGDEDDYDDDDIDFDELKPRLRRPNEGSLFLGSTKITTKTEPLPGPSKTALLSTSSSSKSLRPTAGPSAGFSDDSNSNTANTRLTCASRTSTNNASDINRFLFRDRQIVEALSTKEVVVTSREEKDRVIHRELKRVLQSKSIFDQLYT